MTRRAKTWTAVAALIVVPYVAARYVAARFSPRASSEPPVLEASRSISYVTVDSWQIPNGGNGKVILVQPNHRNETDLRALGEQLRNETSHDRNALVHIYDSGRAASLHRYAFTDRISKEDQAFYEEHKIGVYIRNANTGHHSLTLSLKGLNGDFMEISYR
jgi:hypothetical protein